MSRIKSLLIAYSRIALVGIFWIAIRLRYSVKVSGLEHKSGADSTYYAMEHKRDIDPLVETPSVLTHRGWRALAGEVQFGLRADAFTPGFLGRIVRSPRWFARLLRVLSLSSVLRAIGMHPAESLRLRAGEVWIQEWLRISGDAPAGEILAAAFLRRVAARVGENPQALAEQPVSHLLAWRYHQALLLLYSADIFLEPARGRMKTVVLQHVKEELAELSACLVGGSSLWGSPEGQLSQTGVIGPITDALPRIIQDARRDTRVVPLSIIYDFMTSGRPRVFAHLSPPLECAFLFSPTKMKARLREQWLLGTYFTCTQLAAGFLVQAARSGSLAFTLDDLSCKLMQSATRLSESGRLVDPRLLTLRKAKKLARHFLTYAKRYKFVRAAGYATWIPTIGSLELHVNAGDVGYRYNPLAYAWNELQDMLSARS